MSGIGTEIRVFCYAILTGVLIVAVYLWIRVLRRLVAHRLWLINLEDACNDEACTPRNEPDQCGTVPVLYEGTDG